jgi:fumarate reductase subunit C
MGMREDILANIDNPGQLERLYRTDKRSFRRVFNTISADVRNHPLVAFWQERLNFAGDDITWGSAKERIFALVAIAVAGLIAKLPALLSINEEFFYSRNAAFIVVPLLTAYFAFKNQLPMTKMMGLAWAFIAGMIYINLLPDDRTSDTLILSCLHMPIVLWFLLGFAFAGGSAKDNEKRLSFLRYNGEVVVMTGLILIGGMMLSGVTVGLFSLIGLRIEEVYFQNVGVVGLAAAPILGTWLTDANPQLVGKVSPVIARIFSPLVLVMLAVYLVAIVYSGKDPYTDREFLMMFNALLVGVMAIIFFSIAETSRSSERRWETWVLFLLSGLTIIVNGIALSAILFRISEWGFTPNRTAVLGSNLLMLAHLLIVAFQLGRVLTGKAGTPSVGKSIAAYLPVYFLWAIIVTFVLPEIFGFR